MDKVISVVKIEEIIELVPRKVKNEGLFTKVKNTIFNYRWWLGLKPKFINETKNHKFEVSVIIPAYNEEKSIRDTVLSVVSQTYKPKRIFVVDDFSKDKTFEIAKGLEKEFDNVYAVRTPKNTGTKARAQNYVLDKIDTELFITIDGDTILHSEAIGNMVPYFNDPACFSVCGFIIPQKLRTVWERGRLVDYIYGLTLYKSAQNHQGVVVVSSGCCSMYSTKISRELGGFDERTMVEDMDLTWTSVSNGYKVYYAKDAMCFPIEPQTFKVYFGQLERWYRGFAQCVKVRNFNMFKTNFKLGFLVYFYILTMLFDSLFGMPIMFWFIINGETTAQLMEAFIGYNPFAGLSQPYKLFLGFSIYFLFESLILAIFTLPRGYKLGIFWKTFLSIPCVLVTSNVNRVCYLYSLFVEWVLGRTLNIWVKGH